MYLTEQELKGQFQAVARTLEALHAKRAEAVAALAGVQTLCALGCGSSFSLAKSAAIQFSQHTGVPAYALAAGDLLVNFPAYEKMLRGTTLLLLSRSGSTSEVVRAAERCKNELGCKLLSICAREGTALEALAASARRALEAAGFSLEKKPFVPHITLARKVRSPAGLEPLLIPGLFPTLETQVSKLTLSSSERVEGVLRYLPLYRASL